MALLNFKYGQGTPAAYEQGTIYVSGDNKKIYVGDPNSTSGAGFCVGDFIEVSVAASGKQEEVLGAITAPQQNVLYLTNNVTDGYDLWKYTGSSFVNLTKTGTILGMISTLTGIVEGINTGLNDYVKKSDAPGYTDILTKTAAAGIYEPLGEAQRVVSAYDQATVQPIAADLAQLGQDVAKNKTDVENTLKDYSTTAQMNTAISTAKSEILGGSTGTLKAAETAIDEAKAAAKAADDKAVQAGKDAAAAQTTANQGVADAKTADDKAVAAKGAADAAQADATKALGKLAGVADGSNVGEVVNAAKTAVLGEANYAQTVKTAYELAGKAESDAANAHAAANSAKGIADGAVERLNAAEPKIKAVEDKLADVEEATVGAALEALKGEILGEEGSTGTIAEALDKAAQAQTTANEGVRLAGEAQNAADAAQKAADDAQADATAALNKLTDVANTVGTSIAAAKTEILGAGHTGTVKDAAEAAATAQTAAEAAQGTANQGVADAKKAQDAADAAQEDATEALTALGDITDVADAIATAKSEILGGSTSTLKAAETAIETLDTKVDDLIEGIDNLSNIMNFIGVTETELKDGENATPVIANNADYAPKAGDVVIYDATEFVYDGSVWQKIGNTSAETEELAALDGRLDKLEGKVAESSDLVKAVDQNASDIAGHETRLDQAELDIDGVQAQLTWGTFTSL